MVHISKKVSHSFLGSASASPLHYALKLNPRGIYIWSPEGSLRRACIIDLSMYFYRTWTCHRYTVSHPSRHTSEAALHAHRGNGLSWTIVSERSSSRYEFSCATERMYSRDVTRCSDMWLLPLCYERSDQNEPATKAIRMVLKIT